MTSVQSSAHFSENCNKSLLNRELYHIHTTKHAATEHIEYMRNLRLAKDFQIFPKTNTLSERIGNLSQIMHLPKNVAK
jgi:hypothetical protein